MRHSRVILIIVSIPLFLSFPVSGQSSPDGRPAIIRDTDIAEGIEAVKEPKELNPDEAKKNIDVGNYYRKKKNYVAAIRRYLTAIEYQPDSDKAYKSLVKAYESLVEAYESVDRTQASLLEAEGKHGKISSAIDAFTDFLSVYPDSVKCGDFRKMITKLEEILSQFDNLQ